MTDWPSKKYQKKIFFLDTAVEKVFNDQATKVIAIIFNKKIKEHKSLLIELITNLTSSSLYKLNPALILCKVQGRSNIA